MNTITRLVTTALVGAALVLPHSAEAQKRGARPRPVPSISQPTNIRNASKGDKTHTSRKQMVASAKAAHNRGKAVLKTARRDLAAVTRSEARNRLLRTDGKNRLEQAYQAYRANPTEANQANWIAANQQYQPLKLQHENALSTLRSQRRRVEQLEQLQNQALNAVRATQGLRPSAPRTGQPRFSARPAQFVRPVSAYDRVAAPQQIYGGGQVQQVNASAMAPQGTAAFALNAQQVLLRDFNQQRAQDQALAANGQVRAGPANNVYQRAPAAQNAYDLAAVPFSF